MPQGGGALMAALSHAFEAYQQLCSFAYREHPSGLLWRHRFHSTAGLSPPGERAACVGTRSRGLEPGLDHRRTLDDDDTDQAVGSLKWSISDRLPRDR
jgi:hypothetical protein